MPSRRPKSPAPSRRRALALAALLAPFGLPSLLPAQDPGAPGAQEAPLVEHKTPATIYLNLDAIESGAPLPALPLWVESFEITGANPPPETPDAATWSDPADLDLLADDTPLPPASDPVAYREQELLRGLVRPSPAEEETGATASAASPASGAEPDPAGLWTVARLTLRANALPGQYLFLRLLFDDMPGRRPVVTSWSETGEILYRSEPLGAGTGLPSSEGLLVPAARAASVEVALPGNGSNLRGLFLSAARTLPAAQVVDFASDSPTPDPFSGAAAPSASAAGAADSLLFGRLLATIDPATVPLSPAAGSLVVYEFDLAEAPQAAVIAFEVLNADPSSPPTVALNGADAGPASLHLPDLADPAYSALLFNASEGVRLRYAGWAGAQKFFAGTALRAGVNRLAIRSGDDASGIALRAVRIQLKYPH